MLMVTGTEAQVHRRRSPTELTAESLPSSQRPELCDGQVNACKRCPLLKWTDQDGYVARTIDSNGWDGVAGIAVEMIAIP